MKISERCYVIHGLTTIPPWMVNSGFIVGDEITLIVDCGSNYLSAKTIYGYAKAVKPENKLIAINTEPHFDHMGGNCFFQEMGVDIYGHKDINRNEAELSEVKKAFNKCITSELRRHKREEELIFYKTTVVNPNLGISSDFPIDIGGVVVKILLTPGHTSMNLSVYIEDESVLFCGDVIISDYIPNLEDGEEDDWKEWILSIEKIQEISPEVIIPGHGDILSKEKQINEITRMKGVLNSAIKNGNLYF